jgi:hypothetical protein
MNCAYVELLKKGMEYGLQAAGVKQPEGCTPCLNYTLRRQSHNINLVDLPGALELFCA